MMGARAHLLVLLCLLGAGATFVGAQTLPPPPASAAQSPRTTPFGPTTSTVIAVAIIIFFVLLLLCAYIIQRHLDCDSVAAAARAGGPFTRGKRGLDPAVVATFPIVPYGEVKEHKIGSGVLECAVCLTAFEEGDDLRLLPHCFHAFHPQCIDPWLKARITCPLCRANLEKLPQPALPRQPSPSPTPPHAVAIAIPPVQEEEEESDEDDRKGGGDGAQRAATGEAAVVELDGALALRGIFRRGRAERPREVHTAATAARAGACMMTSTVGHQQPTPQTL